MRAMTNPYRAPATDTASPPTTPSEDAVRRPIWFTPGQIGWSSLLATPLVAGLLIAANSRAAGDSGRARGDIAIGAGLLAAAVAVSFIPRVPGIVGVVWALAMYNWGKQRWAAWMEGHPRPEARSSWHAVAYTLVTLGALLAVLFLAMTIIDAVAPHWLGDEDVFEPSDDDGRFAP